MCTNMKVIDHTSLHVGAHDKIQSAQGVEKLERTLEKGPNIPITDTIIFFLKL